jgi:hypothetical protein
MYPDQMEGKARDSRGVAGERRGGGERLGDALMNAVEETSAPPAAAKLDWGSRAFVAVVEGDRERGRATAERPRLGAVLLATALCAGVTLGIAAWPALVAGAQSASRARTATVVTPAAQSSPSFAHQQVSGPGTDAGFVLTGQWTAVGQGGYPGFTGPIAWTTSAASKASWTLGPTSGGARWDEVRVQIWIPAQHAGAWVHYVVTATAGGASRTQTHSYDIAQQTASGWLALPGTFAVGTPTQRAGSIGVEMTYLRPYAGATGAAKCPSANSCSAMAAGQVAFQWS